jgi:hypothetical protein
MANILNVTICLTLLAFLVFLDSVPRIARPFGSLRLVLEDVEKIVHDYGKIEISSKMNPHLMGPTNSEAVGVQVKDMTI